jgi:hypothetical protein
MSCVTTMLVTWSSFCSFWIMAPMRSMLAGSRPVVGSSYRITSGLMAMERARAARLRMPPDRLAGMR